MGRKPKLTDELRRAIRAAKASGMTRDAIASKFSISAGTVSNALKGPDPAFVAPDRRLQDIDAELESLRTDLQIQQGRLKIGVRGELAGQKLTSATTVAMREKNRILKEIAKLETEKDGLLAPKESSNIEPKPRPLPELDEEESSATQDDIRKLLKRRSAELEQLIDMAKDGGDVGRYASLMRIANGLTQILAKLTPPPAPDPDEAPDMRLAAEQCRAKLHEVLDRVLAERAETESKS